MNHYRIRSSRMEDLDTILELYAKAREFMAANGNPDQWGTSRPDKEQVIADISSGKSHVCIDEADQIVGTFYFAVESDPCYAVIEEGNWKDDKPYAVIHRITALAGTKGVASYCFRWCFEMFPNLRIDTHKKNLPMQRALQKNGFEYCGVIHLEDGAERIGFQKKP